MNKDDYATAQVQTRWSSRFLQAWKLPASEYRRVNPEMWSSVGKTVKGNDSGVWRYDKNDIVERMKMRCLLVCNGTAARHKFLETRIWLFSNTATDKRNQLHGAEPLLKTGSLSAGQKLDCLLWGLINVFTWDHLWKAGSRLTPYFF